MPKGTPLWPKCPVCRWSCKRTRPTGRIELKIHRSAHKGHGSGGRSFIGHRGEMRCDDCGHTWFSTHAASNRIRCSGGEDCTHTEEKS